MNVPGFTTESLSIVQSMLYAEGQRNPLEGECGQKKKRESMQQPRTQEQEQADQARSQAMQGKTRQSSSTRSEAAKKAAETRKQCKGGNSVAGPTTT
jgi:hypothetical protein